jgi:hypothetical protein
MRGVRGVREVHPGMSAVVAEHRPGGHLRGREVVRGAVVKATAAAETPAVLEVAAHWLAHGLVRLRVHTGRARVFFFFFFKEEENER